MKQRINNINNSFIVANLLFVAYLIFDKSGWHIGEDELDEMIDEQESIDE